MIVIEAFPDSFISCWTASELSNGMHVTWSHPERGRVEITACSFPSGFIAIPRGHYSLLFLQERQPLVSAIDPRLLPNIPLLRRVQPPKPKQTDSNSAEDKKQASKKEPSIQVSLQLSDTFVGASIEP